MPSFTPPAASRLAAVDKALVDLVRRRAHDCCEYCRMPAHLSILPFEIDHIIAQKHHGKTTSSNLALACAYENAFKGPNIAGLDPRTGRLVRLFHPRRHKWDHHFQWDGPVLVGRTAIGRATIDVLAVNQPLRVEQRRALIEAGLFPPLDP
jgi:hypothetical protein